MSRQQALHHAPRNQAQVIVDRLVRILLTVAIAGGTVLVFLLFLVVLLAVVAPDAARAILQGD